MYSKKQRIAAMAGIILLVLLYIATFIFAILDFNGADKMFMICLVSTIAVPLIIWIFIAMHKKGKGEQGE